MTTGSPAEVLGVPWFTARAEELGLALEIGPDGTAWAWWTRDGRTDPAVVTGGADVAAGFEAIERLQAQGCVPAHPLGVVRLASGAPETSIAARIACFVEVGADSSGRLAEAGSPLGIGTGIWPHGRWRFEFGGEAAAGAVSPPDERDPDPAVDAARLILLAQELAAQHRAAARVVRLVTQAGGVHAWLDARAPSPADLLDLVTLLVQHAAGGGARATEEYWIPATTLDPGLRDRVAAAADRTLTPALGQAAQAPLLSSAHDRASGALTRAGVPSSLIVVRGRADHSLAVAALAAALHDLAQPSP